MSMSLNAILSRTDSEWLNDSGPEHRFVMSTRVRLARNVDGLPFPHRGSAADAARVMDLAGEIAVKLNRFGHFGRLESFEIGDLPVLDRKVLVEKHLMSIQLLQPIYRAALVVSDSESVSIMVNEEDHFRIQCLGSGLNLEGTLEQATRADDVIGDRVDYAFDSQFGYLTSCPTNVGTGLRASVMMHLPGLVLTGHINRVIATMGKLGVVVRGFYGEGTEATGNIFQISNQLTLGRNELEIVNSLEGMVRQIIGHEQQAREQLMAGQRLAVEDRVWRAYAVLTHARVLSWEEATAHISDVKLGLDLGLLTEVNSALINQLIIAVRPAFVRRKVGRELNNTERRAMRADMVRAALEENN